MLVLEPQKSIYFQILREPKLSRALSHESGASGSPVRKRHHSSLRGKMVEHSLSHNHTTLSISNSIQTSWGDCPWQGRATRSQEFRWWGKWIFCEGETPIIFMGKMAPASKPHRSDWHLWICPDLYTSPGSWLLSREWGSHGDGDRQSRRWDYCIPPCWCLKKGSPPPLKGDIWGVEECLRTRILVAVFSPLFLEPQTPVLLYLTLVWSALPLLKPKVNGYK